MSTLFDRFRRMGGAALVLVVSAVLLALIPAATHAQKTFSSDDIIFHFHGISDSSQLGWSAVNTLGDVNGDGYDDIAATCLVPEGIYVFFGGNPTDTTPDMFLRGNYGQPQAIDFDGDGIDEVITSQITEDYPIRTGVVYFYKGYGDSIGSLPYDSLWTDSTQDGFGWFMHTAYFDSDSLGDLMVTKETDQYPHKLELYLGGTTLDRQPDWDYVAPDLDIINGNFGFIDYDGDGHLDVFAAHNYRDSGYVAIFLGPNLGQSHDIYINPPKEFDTLSEVFGRSTSNIGDVDGDGWDDLGICWPQVFNLRGLIYLCGPFADTLYDFQLGNKTQLISAVGDFNGDHFNDIAAYGSHSDFGGVDVYSGGPVFDTVCDGWIERADLPPHFVDDIGRQISSAGDFNGDGYDDILFSTGNFSGSKGELFVLAGGPKIPTEVKETENEHLPDGLQLGQNYPNPFNLTTTIEFSLKARSHVTLMIYNVLGREVATIVDEIESAGRHVVQWDGKDAGGSPVASGVYLYRLSVGDRTEIRKMVLLK